MVPDPATFPLTPADIRRALVRYRVRAAAFFLAVCALTLLGAMVMPRTYLSEAKLFVRFGRENMALDPTAAAAGSTISVNESRESEINSLLEVLRSRALLDQTIERIGAENLIAGTTPPDDGRQMVGTFVSTEAKEPAYDAAHQKAVQLLERNVHVQTPRKSNVISVSAKAASPELAQKIVGELVDLYLHEHTRVNSTAGSFEFFEQQTTSLRTQWQEALEALRKAKDQYEIVTVEGKRQALEARIAQIEALQSTNTADLAQSRARGESLAKLIQSAPQSLITDTAGFPNIPDDSLRSGYHQLELKASDLHSRYNEKHPLAKLMQMQLEEGRKSLTDGAGRVQTTKAEHPTRLALDLALLNEQANERSLEARGATLITSAAETVKELRELNRQEVEIAGLTQRSELVGRHYQEAAEKLEQSRVSRALDRDGISNLRLVQPASFNPKAKGVGRTAVCGLGGLVAFVGAFGLALVSAWLNPQLRSVNELQTLFGAPVIATIRRNTFAVPAPQPTADPMPA